MQRKSSMRDLQARALEENFLDLLGSDSDDFAPVTLDEVSKVLYDVALEYVILAKQNLADVDRVSAGSLSDSIIPTRVSINGSVYNIDINILDYYKFVDKGVKGWQSGGGNSPYQFKAPVKGKRYGQKASAFVTSIRKWVIKEGLSSRATKKPITRRETSRLKKSAFTDTSTRTAIVIAAAIRRRGLEPTNFWTDAETEMGKRIGELFGLALKIDIINSLKWE